MKKICLDADDDCPLCHLAEDTIDHLFKNCDMTKYIQVSIDMNYPNTNNSYSSFIAWLEHIWKFKFSYNKVFHNPLERSFTICVDNLE